MVACPEEVGRLQVGHSWWTHACVRDKLERWAARTNSLVGVLSSVGSLTEGGRGAGDGCMDV